MNRYTIDPIVFECGDFGFIKGYVEGYVIHNDERTRSYVTGAFALVDDKLINVTAHLTPAARTDLEEKLEEKHLREMADPRTGRDDFGRGA